MYNSVSKGVKDVMVDRMVEDATRALEVVADELWVLWVECQVRAEAEKKVCE